jgi:hypothetical protein
MFSAPGLAFRLVRLCGFNRRRLVAVVFERLSGDGRADGMVAYFGEQVVKFDGRHLVEAGLRAEIDCGNIHNPKNGYEIDRHGVPRVPQHANAGVTRWPVLLRKQRFLSYFSEGGLRGGKHVRPHKVALRAIRRRGSAQRQCGRRKISKGNFDRGQR